MQSDLAHAHCAWVEHQAVVRLGWGILLHATGRATSAI